MEGGSPVTAAAEPRSGVSLTRDLSEFLIELSIAAHRYAIYPQDHPSLGTASADLCARLHPLLRQRGSVSLGVAQDQLVIDGVATDRKNPVLVDLARRLHAHQLGAVTFSTGFEPASLQGLLRALASDQDGEDALGLRPHAERPSWPGVTLSAVGYDDLEIEDQGRVQRPGSALELWIGLARAAVATESDDPRDDTTVGRDRAVPDTDVVAEHINAQDRDRAYDQIIIGYLLQLSEELGKGAEADEAVRRNVSQLVQRLDDTTLRRILEMGGDMEARRAFVASALESLPSMAVIRLLDAAADVSGSSISRSLTMLLTKLAVHAEADDEQRAGEGSAHLAENVSRMLDDWELESPNPEQYARALRDLSNLSGAGSADVTGAAVSVVQMAMEVGQWGDSVERALVELVELGGLARVAPLILSAGSSDVAQRMRERLSDPTFIAGLSAQSEVDAESLSLLTSLLDPQTAARSLVDLVVTAEADAVRAAALEQLAPLAEHLGPELDDLLHHEDSGVVLAALSLVRAGAPCGDGCDPSALVGHPDPDVRRAALELALLDPQSRASALADALQSGDEHLQGTALEQVRPDDSPTLLTLVVDRFLRRPDAPPWLVRTAVHALSQSQSEIARAGLLEVVVAGRSWWGRIRIAPPEREVLEALEALRAYRGHPEVAAVLAAAGRSRDERVRRAAGSGGRT